MKASMGREQQESHSSNGLSGSRAKRFREDGRMPVSDEYQRQIRLEQNHVLVWVHSLSSPEGREDIRQFEKCTTRVLQYADPTEFVDFIRRASDTKVQLIISLDPLENTMQSIHDLGTLDSVYVLGEDDAKYRSLVQSYCKIKFVASHSRNIVDHIYRQTRLTLESDIKLNSVNGSVVDRSSNDLNCSFMYSQLLADILLEIEWTTLSKAIFVQFSREQYADNKKTLCTIDEFERQYDKEHAVSWYTRDSFVYRLLNRSLRENDFTGSYVMGFFIKDLHNQLTELCNKSLRVERTVYRGQG